MSDNGYSFRLREVLADKIGADFFSPSASLLSELHMTADRFQNIYNGTSEPFFSEIVALSRKFNIATIEELVGAPLRSKARMKVVKSKSKTDAILSSPLAQSLAAKYRNIAI